LHYLFAEASGSLFLRRWPNRESVRDLHRREVASLLQFNCVRISQSRSARTLINRLQTSSNLSSFSNRTRYNSYPAANFLLVHLRQKCRLSVPLPSSIRRTSHVQRLPCSCRNPLHPSPRRMRYRISLARELQMDGRHPLLQAMATIMDSRKTFHRVWADFTETPFRPTMTTLHLQCHDP
jgi:hypothetical protein